MRGLMKILLLCFIGLLTACSPGLGENDTGSTGAETSEADKILIVYFSQSGNTEQIAEYIQQDTGADLFKITTVKPYPDKLEELYEIGQAELDANARPELNVEINDMESYDTIFLGYPIWGGTCPMAVFSFIEQYDFSGKKIIPFCTHGGSGFSESLSDIEEMMPEGITMEPGFSISGSKASDAQTDVKEWLDGLGLNLQ